MFDFGVRARELLQQRGLSLRAAARALYVDHAYLSRVLSGRQKPSADLVLRLDELLQADGALAALMPDPEPVEEVERVTGALGNRYRPDDAVADWVARCLVEHRLVEDRIGGAAILPVVKAQLATVDQLRSDADGHVRDRLLQLGSEYGQFLGWVYEDARDFTNAIRWYDLTGELAIEAGNPNMAATVRSMKAHAAWLQSDGFRTVRLAEAALWHDGRVAPGVDALSLAQLARGHAMQNDPDAAHRALDRARERWDASAADPDSEPPWVYFSGPTWYLHQQALVEIELGRGEAAVRLLDNAVKALPESYHRDRVRFLAFKARALVLAGELAAAADLAEGLAPDAVALNGSAVHDLRGVATTISGQLPARGRELAAVLRAG